MTPRKKDGPGSHLSAVIERNIDTLLEVRRQMERRKSHSDRLADGITGFFGSTTFVLMHVAWFTLWIFINLGWLGVPAFDRYPYGLLTTIVSLEAIFLSTFVLIRQNRMAVLDEDRADLDLQIDLLAEYEITKTLKLTNAIADHLGLKEGQDPELDDLEHTVAPELVLQAMEKKKKALHINGKA